MSFGEKMAMGGQVTGLGLVVVFTCLVLIIALVVLLSFVLKDRKAKGEKKAPVQTKEETAEFMETAVIQPDVPDDAELVAVLTAAAICMVGAQPGSLVVRSYRRVGSGDWRRTGRDEQIL